MPRLALTRTEIAALADKLLAEQGGKCAIRGCPGKPVTRRFHVDHDHKTGAVRGLICHRHNRIMPNGSREAYALAEYLAEHEANSREAYALAEYLAEHEANSREAYAFAEYLAEHEAKQ